MTKDSTTPKTGHRIDGPGLKRNPWPRESLELNPNRGGEWYLEKRGSRNILAGSRNLGNVFDKSRSLVFSWFVFTFFESRNFSPKSLGLGFLTRISASRRVSDFTIRHPSKWRQGLLFHSHNDNFHPRQLVSRYKLFSILQVQKGLNGMI